LVLTPPFHQPCVLQEPSSVFKRNGRLVLGRVSHLDAFSGYPLLRGCPASALPDNR